MVSEQAGSSDETTGKEIYPKLSIEEAKVLIVRRVNELQGCKATELAAEPAIACCGHSFPDLLDELIHQGLIREIEYVVPDVPWRAKSFLLPKGSTVRQ